MFLKGTVDIKLSVAPLMVHINGTTSSRITFINIALKIIRLHNLTEQV